MMRLKPKHRLIFPRDHKKDAAATFTIAELKILQAILLEQIDKARKEENAEYEDYNLLTKKLEYFLSEE